MIARHLDEARRDAIAAVHEIVESKPEIERLALIDDLFGSIRIVFWAAKSSHQALRDLIADKLSEAASPFWSGDIWFASNGTESDRKVYEAVWEEARHLAPRLRLAERVRNRAIWFRPTGTAIWSATGERFGPPIIVFYSFKGGVGRTTSLTSFAIQRARLGERTVVLDLDLDGPGVGTLLAADEHGATSAWGVTDYLLESNLGQLDLRDYYHACRRAAVTGSGEILVMPAGSLDPERDYLSKLARLDLEPPAGSDKPVLQKLLEHIRADLKPDWILLDARAGLSEPAGLLLSGLAHLHVLFGTFSEQSWRGLQPVLHRIGASRVYENRPQLDCLLVQAMVPADTEASQVARQAFSDRALTEFKRYYYAPDPDDPDEDTLWYVRDSEGSDAPHAPIPLTYQPRLAHFARIDDVADELAENKEFLELGSRIAQRFAQGDE